MLNSQVHGSIGRLVELWSETCQLAVSLLINGNAPNGESLKWMAAIHKQIRNEWILWGRVLYDDGLEMSTMKQCMSVRSNRIMHGGGVPRTKQGFRQQRRYDNLTKEWPLIKLGGKKA